MRLMTIEQVLDLFARYPFLWAPTIATLWAVVTGALSWALDRTMPRTDAEWADLFARKPRIGALAAILKTAGFNLPGFIRSIRALLKGPPPPIARPVSRAELFDALGKLADHERAALVTVLRDENPCPPNPTPPGAA